MNSNSPQNDTHDHLGRTLREDFRRGDFWRNIRRDFSDLEDFYIDTEKKTRLDQMNRLKRFFYFVWWLMRSIFLKLNPVRRILTIIGIILILSPKIIIDHEEQEGANNRALLGGAIIVFVLMLEVKDKLLARDELEAGRKVQQALMPERSPSVPGWSLWLFTRPANEVGGDLVDFIHITDDRSAVVMADVAGKGLKAALLTAKLQATIRAFVSDYDLIADLCTKINRIFHRDSLPTLFASLLYVELQHQSNKLRFVNAGHLPPVLVNADGYTELSKGEPALGLIDNTRYGEQTLDLQSGDLFLAYSDGLTEARNEQGEFFGQPKLFSLLPQLVSFSAQIIGEKIVEEVDRFVAEARGYDDLTIAVLKRT